MTLVHLHLLLNHVPTIGTAVALTLFVLSFFRRNEALRRVSLELFFMVALFTIPAYITGLASQLAISDREGVSTLMIEAHEDAAIWSFILMQLTGGFAWVGLWQYRRSGRWVPAVTAAIALLGALTMAVTARAANLGGEIRHPELMSMEIAEMEAQLSSDPPWLSANDIGFMMTERTWLWPAAETLHFIGMWLLFGVMLFVNLRMLGFLRAWSFPAVHRLLPWAALGFAINTVTGMWFLTSAPAMYAENISFIWKIGFLMLAGVNLLYSTVFEGAWHVDAGQRSPMRVKAMGAAALISWVGVMYFGRMLPFIGEAF